MTRAARHCSGFRARSTGRRNPNKNTNLDENGDPHERASFAVTTPSSQPAARTHTRAHTQARGLNLIGSSRGRPNSLPAGRLGIGKYSFLVIPYSRRETAFDSSFETRLAEAKNKNNNKKDRGEKRKRSRSAAAKFSFHLQAEHDARCLTAAAGRRVRKVQAWYAGRGHRGHSL